MSFPRTAKIALGLSGTFMLAACIPLPHHITLSPAIDGTLHRNGKPVANARLYVERGEQCSYTGELFSTSNAAGIFHIPLRQGMVYVLAMDPEPGPTWRLCITDGDRLYEGWYEESLMHYDAITLDCNLESPLSTWNWRGIYNIQYTAAGVCRSRADEAQGRLTPAVSPAPGERR